jgi:hypothetical protein
LAKGVLGVVTVAGTIIFSVLALGLVFPVVNTHCVEGTDVRDARVESGWQFNWIGGGFPNPAPDTEGCVRNTPTREALSALGIWDLGSPENQVARNVLE